MTLQFVIASLACWRLTSLLIREDGPFDFLLHIRSLSGRYRVLQGAFSCVWCLSVWIGIAVSVVMFTPLWPLLTPFALSAVAIGFELAKDAVRD